MLLRRLSCVLWNDLKCFSTAKNNVKLSLDEHTGVTTVIMRRTPVNSMNTELLAELGQVFGELEQSNSRGMILTSDIPNIFSAGLDLLEFYKPDEKKLTNFWTTLQNTWLQLYTSSYPTVALINGHSPAGGCLFAMSCEYRIMVGHGYTIGLNEGRIGIPAPIWFMDVMRNTIGHRMAEMSLCAAEMYPADKARAIGLVDDIASDSHQSLNHAKEFLDKQHKCDALTRSIMKQGLRQELVEKFHRIRDADLKFTLAGACNDGTQRKLEKYIEAMRKKK